MDHPQPTVTPGVALQDLAAAIGRPVVHANRVEGDPVDILGRQRVKKHGKKAGLVEDRDDNGNVTPLIHAGIVTPAKPVTGDFSNESSPC